MTRSGQMPRRRGVIALLIVAGILLTALQAVLSRPLKLHRQHTRSNDTARRQGLAARLLAEEPDWESQGLKLTQTVIKWREDSGLSLYADDSDVLPSGGTAAPAIPKTMHATTKVGAVVNLTLSALASPRGEGSLRSRASWPLEPFAASKNESLEPRHRAQGTSTSAVMMPPRMKSVC